MTNSPLTSQERESLYHCFIIGHEVASTARALGSDYLAAHVHVDGGLVVFTYDCG